MGDQIYYWEIALRNAIHDTQSAGHFVEYHRAWYAKRKLGRANPAEAAWSMRGVINRDADRQYRYRQLVQARNQLRQALGPTMMATALLLGRSLSEGHHG